jgi:hypothetical protein
LYLASIESHYWLTLLALVNGSSNKMKQMSNNWLPTQLAFVQATIDQNGCHNGKSYNVDVDENKFQGFHTICELNVILYGLFLLLKTMGFYKDHIMN